MRLIFILIALAIVGLLINQQLNKAPVQRQIDSNPAVNSTLPAVPSRPQDVPQFKQDVETYLQDAAAERAKKIEKFEKEFSR